MADPIDKADNTALDSLIRRQIACCGGIPFSDYMQHCLYHPQYGYYMRNRQRIGSQGDFFTSSSVHRLFGMLIARQLVQMWELLGSSEFTIVEQGAGEGHLALDILDTLMVDAPRMYGQVRYQIVEISADNCQRQAAILSVHQGKVEWCPFEHVADIDGCFLSNELVDAFPVALVEKHSDGYSEVFVVEHDGVLSEELRPAGPQFEEHFRALGVEPAVDNRAEVSLSATTWIQDVAKKLRRGFVLTIDYGYPAVELYAPFRRHGTLLCYHQHIANDNPYQNPGCQDITSHVDFTLLQHFGSAAGLQTVYFGEQYRFLIGLGFIEELIQLQARETDENKALALRMTLKNLILPDGGMGEIFKVLIQGKGVDESQLLCSRAVRDIPIAGLMGL